MSPNRPLVGASKRPFSDWGSSAPIWSSWTFSRTSGRQLLVIQAWSSIIYVEMLGRWYCFLQVHQNHQTMALRRSTYERKKQRALWKGNVLVFRVCRLSQLCLSQSKSVISTLFPNTFRAARYLTLSFLMFVFQAKIIGYYAGDLAHGTLVTV